MILDEVFFFGNIPSVSDANVAVNKYIFAVASKNWVRMQMTRHEQNSQNPASLGGGGGFSSLVPSTYPKVTGQAHLESARPWQEWAGQEQVIRAVKVGV